ncbi:NAD(P)H-dependent oxidoreductase [Arsenicicoccus sp. oral taxon 190]|uniref:NAD(P)H-dependent oxidoreductase n=1 Tax=Arsenicicoccus sp. oral taxon 190 TaxID=1658671 RepID=UPI00067AF73B|nr:NAD(P)H-dependent oxidoreductase [Arsenicicoccus sp. oral taxon 190]
MTIRVVAVSAGLRPTSATRRLADLLLRACEEQLRRRPEQRQQHLSEHRAGDDDVRTAVVELAPVAHAALDRLMTGAPSAELDAALGQLGGADALVVVTPTYNGSFSGLLKLVLDVADRTRLRHTPAIVAGTGGSLRHTSVPDLAVRPLLTALRLHVAPTSVFAAPPDWQEDGSPTPALADRAAEAAAQLLALVEVDRGCAVDRGAAPAAPAGSTSRERVTPLTAYGRAGSARPPATVSGRTPRSSRSRPR